MEEKNRQIRFELLRPKQLLNEKEKCPLIFIPVGPLEYHGPHLPLGVDALNATYCAQEVCKRIGRGVVLPTIYFGTERERPSRLLKNFGFKPTDWIVGMDFPTALWKSHYYQEHILGLVISSKIEVLINHNYKVIIIVNGHGAQNQKDILDKLSKHYSNTSDCLVTSGLAFPDELIERKGEHAAIYETSLMIYYQKKYGLGTLVDLLELPEKNIPICYADFSIVDGPGFGRNPDPDKIVKDDPRNAKEEIGEEMFEKVVQKFLKITEAALKEINN